MGILRLAARPVKFIAMRTAGALGLVKPERPESVDDGRWQRHSRRHLDLIDFMLASGLRKEHRILDVGCGLGGLLGRLSKAGFRDLHGCDWLDQELDFAAYHKVDLNADALGRYADDSFDVIISSDVVEHMENPSRILREFARVVRPGGHIFVTIPSATNLFERLHFLLTGNSTRYNSERVSGPYGHINLFTSNILESLADKAGIEQVSMKGGAGFFFGYFTETTSPLLAFNLMYHYRPRPSGPGRALPSSGAPAAASRPGR